MVLEIECQQSLANLLLPREEKKAENDYLLALNLYLLINIGYDE